MPKRERRVKFAEHRRAHGFSQERLASAVGMEVTAVRRWERGDQDPQPEQRRSLCRLLDLTPGELDSLLAAAPPDGAAPERGDELDALEITRTVQASDVGTVTLDELEQMFDELAILYQTTSPAVLLRHVRRQSTYVNELMEGRATLAERRRLYVAGSWLSLLAATLHVDLRDAHAARSRLRAATLLAQHAEHRELQAWACETAAWRSLTAGDYPRAVELSRAAQDFAPRGSSVQVQATAQEGRARARMGEHRDAYRAIDRVRHLASAMQLKARREHHYQYDPAKASSYEATTLAWTGDPAAEVPAREVIATVAPNAPESSWPRRVVTAHLDLALTLLTGDRLDEACDAARRAVMSGRVLPVNHWRVHEIVTALEARQLPEAVELREAYEELRTGSD